MSDEYDRGFEEGLIEGEEHGHIEALKNDLQAIRAAFPCDLALRARLFRLGLCGASGDPWQALERLIEHQEGEHK